MSFIFPEDAPREAKRGHNASVGVNKCREVTIRGLRNLGGNPEHAALQRYPFQDCVNENKEPCTAREYHVMKTAVASNHRPHFNRLFRRSKMWLVNPPWLVLERQVTPVVQNLVFSVRTNPKACGLQK
jgi:hypothetical protein